MKGVFLLILLVVSGVLVSFKNRMHQSKSIQLCTPVGGIKNGDDFTFPVNDNPSDNISFKVIKILDERMQTGFKDKQERYAIGQFVLKNGNKEDTAITMSLNYSRPMPVAVHEYKRRYVLRESRHPKPGTAKHDMPITTVRHIGVEIYYLIWQGGIGISLCPTLDTLTKAKLILKELNNLDQNDVRLFENPEKSGAGCVLAPRITMPINKHRSELIPLGYEAIWSKKSGYYSLKKK